MQTANRFWTRHALLPLLGIVPLLLATRYTDLDHALSRAWAYDALLGAFPARHAFWAENLLHEGGRNFVLLVVVACAALLAASWHNSPLRPCRRQLLYIILAIGVGTGLIGLLKDLTGVQCPWDLQEFGGLARGRGACFPGGHSGSGFALVAVYFALRDQRPRLARAALLFALLTGAAFAFAQEARGAHFLSHDLSSAMIAWFVCLGLYRQMLVRTAGMHAQQLGAVPFLFQEARMLYSSGAESCGPNSSCLLSAADPGQRPAPACVRGCRSQHGPSAFPLR